MENVELPQQYMFKESAPGMVSVKDKPMYRVVKNSSTYAETVIKLLGILHEGEATEVFFDCLHHLWQSLYL